MLSEFQTRKLTHFFNLLDFNDNGVLTRDDFEAIAENLCVLWGFKEGSADYKRVIEKSHESWNSFIQFTEDPYSIEASLSQWLGFCDMNMMSIDENAYKALVSAFVSEIFDYFDSNDDGYISLDEYVDLFMAFRIEIRYSARSFTKLDLNGDELISKNELNLAVSDFFRSDDENDGGNWLFGFWKASKI
ncbi:EF-hand domain-containing protein [Marinoscillum sp. MHG1-6]|uniref:EF-hand domain-containing protein n=1 Tax=Marinoscillum sp. MHG1-6 TaxID=2959627 RepID=UPI002157ED41|nr:EF-hand domain-containing protein [Marinoscillum sp. MHG1-6]